LRLPFPDKTRKTGRKHDAILTHHSANGIELFVLEQGQGPLVLLCHGWPELSYSWRHQIPAIAEAGFHVVSPRHARLLAAQARRQISVPTASSTMSGDMVAIVSALGEKQGRYRRHDWGAPVAWHAAMFRPDIFTKVAGLSVPPPFRGRGRPLDYLESKTASPISTGKYFQAPGVAEAEFERDVRSHHADRGWAAAASRSVRPTSRSGGPGVPCWRRSPAAVAELADEADIATFAEIYRKSASAAG